MAHLAQSLIKLLGLVLVASCRWIPSGDLPAVNSEEVAVSKHQGITSVAGRPFSGALYQLNEQGDTLEIKRYLDGRPHGIAKKWYLTGQIHEIRPYLKGRAHGQTLIWWENGNRKAEYHFEEGLYHGSCNEWRAEGQLIKKMNFVHGREEGRQQLWNEKGELWANYDARNGRHYGMTGKKGCATVWENDSVYVAKK